MPVGIFETWSKRQKKKERSRENDVYVYDDLPKALRNQVIHIWASAIGVYVPVSRFEMSRPPVSNELWELIFNTLTREIGVFSLGNARDTPFEQCQTFLQNGVSRAFPRLNTPTSLTEFMPTGSSKSGCRRNHGSRKRF